ncbi:MAG: O-antigen ligase family protein [Acidobacteria bacterium]|nr:O-antigen ligase family protein [Acidobacteriota bacterium]
MSSGTRALPLAIVIAIVLLPWEEAMPRLPIGSVLVVTLPEIAISLVCLLFLISRSPWPIPRGGTWPALAFVGVLGLSAILAPDHQVDALKFTARMGSGLIFAAAVAAAVQRTQGGARMIRGAIVVSALLPAAAGILEWAVPGFHVASLFHLDPHHLGHLERSTSVFPYPTIFSGYLEMALPYAIFVPLGPFATALFAAGIFSSLTRASVGIAAALGLAGILAGRRFNRPSVSISGAAVLLTLAGFYVATPSGSQGLATHDLGRWYSARIRLLSSDVRHHTDGVYVIRLSVTNDGLARWHHLGTGRFYLSYWPALSECGSIRALSSLLPQDVEPGASLHTSAYVYLPPDCEMVRMSFDMFSENVTPFYIHGSPRLDLAFRRTADGWMTEETTIPAAGFPKEAGRPVKPLPTRPVLWHAAFDIWKEHPILGAGPDSFRYLHGSLLPDYRTSDRVFSNNVYLEILCGSGILGLAAFLWMLISAGRVLATSVVWRDRHPGVALPAALALAAFCLHGLVDCMLLFTPIYAMFWIAYALVFVTEADQV